MNKRIWVNIFLFVVVILLSIIILSENDKIKKVQPSLSAISPDNILKIEGIKEVNLKLVWDPPWTKEKMSEAAKLELNL